MAMTAKDILLHPALERCVRGQAQTLLSMQGASPRLASVFATQQRSVQAVKLAIVDAAFEAGMAQ
jgi:hypothetical protein